MPSSPSREDREWVTRVLAMLDADEQQRLDVLVLRLRLYADAEDGPTFMGWPDRWWDDPHWRCTNGHVSTRVLRSEGLRRDACLACMAPLTLTFPEDCDDE